MREITEEFAREYLEAPTTGLESRIIAPDEIESIPECQRIMGEMQHPDYVLGKSSEFLNNFEKRFDWGVVDLSAEVKGGVIEQCAIYSDSLFPDLIDELKFELQTGIYKYERASFQDLEQKVKEKFKEDSGQLKALAEFCEWMKDVIE